MLEAVARQDAGLIFPLWDAARVRVIDSSAFVVPTGETIAIPQPRGSFERISLRPVRDELIEGAGIESRDWMRRAGISPWIRNRVVGVALDDRMWWIPRMSDDYPVEEPMFLRWIAEEIS